MNHCWMLLVTQLTWTWQTTHVTDHLWAVIGLLATGWFLSTLRE